MKNLYIDFDGVILNTIDVTYRLLEDEQIDLKDVERVQNFYKTLDWKNLLSITPEINNAFSCIQELLESKKFNISILTHVNSMEEIMEKVKFIRKHTDHLTIIPVPKPLSKTKMVRAKDAILIDDYTKNLNEWEKEGGIGIKFSQTPKECKYPIINSLNQLLEMECIK